MKFVHISDLHLDSPFSILSERLDIGEQRRVEQCMVLKKVTEYIKENGIEFLFISGDLYENKYIKKSTIEYINSLFNEISNTKIFISPGNHDPYIKGSPYDLFEFAPNVHIFKSRNLEKYDDGDVIIYGSAFTDFYRDNNPLNCDLKIEREKTNILVLHCDLNGAKNKNEMSYLPIYESTLKSLKFDYCALGHIHKKYISNDSTIVYPGSLVSLGFDELGEHGMVVGEINVSSINTQFIKVDNREFVEKLIDVSDFSSIVSLIQYINTQQYIDINFYKIILAGRRDFDIDIKTIVNSIEHTNILKIEDKTCRSYDFDKIIDEPNLRGAFVRRLRKLVENNEITQEQMDQMLEIGLEAMN